MKDYRCYLFDADGTLIDTVELIYQCFAHTCGRFLGRAVTRDEIHPLVGLPLRTSMERIFGTLTDGRYEEIRSVHMGRQMEIFPRYLKAFPGVADVLGELKARGKRLGVVSSRMMETLGLYLQTVGIRDLFGVVVTPPDTLRHKPDPEPVLKAMSLLGAGPDETVYVGDAAYDVESGARAGADTVFVGWSHNSRAGLPLRPTWYIDRMDQLLADAEGRWR